LLNKNDKLFPDVALLITDVENLKRNLLLFTQIKDLEIPTILVINMADRMKSKGISLDIPLLEAKLIYIPIRLKAKSFIIILPKESRLKL
jgi:ferrous iron transport protein B